MVAVHWHVHHHHHHHQDPDILAALETVMTQNLTDIGAALDAIKASADAAQVQANADRAAFDSLAADVRAFLANLPAAGGTLTADQSAQAQAILDGLGATAAVESQQAADEAALQAEVPAPPAA